MAKQQRGGAEASQSADPFEAWRKFYEANEQIWAKAAKDTTNTAQFAEMQGKMLETFLTFQRAARDGMNAQLATMNLPSRDDVARLGELILGLEEKIDAIDDRLAALESLLAPAREPKGPAKRSARR